jgi:hypothetical protein
MADKTSIAKKIVRNLIIIMSKSSNQQLGIKVLKSLQYLGLFNTFTLIELVFK